MLVRGPLGPPDIICANRVANGLTGDSRGSMKSGRLGAIRWRGFQKGAKKPHEIACSCGFYSGLRNRCTGWLRLPRPADVMRMLLQRPLAEPRVHLYARKRLPAALTDTDSPSNAAMRSVGGLFGLGQVIAVN